MHDSLKHIVVLLVGIGATVLTYTGDIQAESLMLIYGNIMMYVFKNGNSLIKESKVKISKNENGKTIEVG